MGKRRTKIKKLDLEIEKIGKAVKLKLSQNKEELTPQKVKEMEERLLEVLRVDDEHRIDGLKKYICDKFEECIGWR